MTQPDSRARSVGTWILTAALALAFLGAGSSKLAGAEELVANFDRWGYPPWFLTFTGVVELVAVVLILIPKLSPIGALLIVPTMLGAVGTHIVAGDPFGQIVPSLVLLVLGSLLLYLRRDRLKALVPGQS